jgi:hypothetical protein
VGGAIAIGGGVGVTVGVGVGVGVTVGVGVGVTVGVGVGVGVTVGVGVGVLKVPEVSGLVCEGDFMVEDSEIWAWEEGKFSSGCDRGDCSATITPPTVPAIAVAANIKNTVL